MVSNQKKFNEFLKFSPNNVSAKYGATLLSVGQVTPDELELVHLQFCPALKIRNCKVI